MTSPRIGLQTQHATWLPDAQLRHDDDSFWVCHNLQHHFLPSQTCDDPSFSSPPTHTLAMGPLGECCPLCGYMFSPLGPGGINNWIAKYRVGGFFPPKIITPHAQPETLNTDFRQYTSKTAKCHSLAWASPRTIATLSA